MKNRRKVKRKESRKMESKKNKKKMSGSIASYSMEDMKFIINRIYENRSDLENLKNFLARCEMIFPQVNGNWWGKNTIAHLVMAMMGRVDNVMIKKAGYISNVPLYICVHALLNGIVKTREIIVDVINGDRKENVVACLDGKQGDWKNLFNDNPFSRAEKSVVIKALRDAIEECEIKQLDDITTIKFDSSVIDEYIQLYFQKDTTEESNCENDNCLDSSGFVDRENFKFNHMIWLNYYRLVKNPDLYPTISDKRTVFDEKTGVDFWKKYTDYINDYGKLCDCCSKEIAKKNKNKIEESKMKESKI